MTVTYEEARQYFYLKPEDVVDISAIEDLKKNAVKRIASPFDVRDRISAMLMLEACDALLKGESR